MTKHLIQSKYHTDFLLFLAVQVGIYLFLLLFFTQICPLVLYDGDDWQNIGWMRLALPVWGSWNPSRVLPETIMPFAGWIAAYVIYPLNGDYFRAITIGCAIIISAAILLLCLCAEHFFRIRFKVSARLALFLEILFLVLQFFLFRTRGTSRYMFQAYDLTCVFNYTLPGILGMCTVLAMLSYEDYAAHFLKLDAFRKGAFLLLLYLSIFSHDYASEVPAILCGTLLIRNFARERKQCRENRKVPDVRVFCRSNSLYLAGLVLWMVSLLFEAGGGRSAHMENGAVIDIGKAFAQLLAMIQALRPVFALCLILILVWIVARHRRHRSFPDGGGLIRMVLVNLALTTAYLLILSSIVSYMSRIEASWNIWEYLILIVMIGIVRLLQCYPGLKCLMVPALFILMFSTAAPDGRFLISTVNSTDYETCMNTDVYILEQVQTADREGLDSVTITVPSYPDDTRSWIFTNDFGERISQTLYNHGMIRQKLQIEVISDPSLNEEMVRYQQPEG